MVATGVRNGDDRLSSLHGCNRGRGTATWSVRRERHGRGNTHAYHMRLCTRLAGRSDYNGAYQAPSCMDLALQMERERELIDLFGGMSDCGSNING